MSASTSTVGVAPQMQWAQRNTTVLLAILLPDPADVQLRITASDPTAAATEDPPLGGDAQFFSFSCISRPPAVTASGTTTGGAAPMEEKKYACNLKLFAPVTAEESLQTVRARGIQLVLKKKTPDEFWPRLFSDKRKFPNVQIDWAKWKSEDELEEAGGALDDGAADLDDPRGIAELHSTLSILRQNQTAALAERQLVRRNQRKAKKLAGGDNGTADTVDVSSDDDDAEGEVEQVEDGPVGGINSSGDKDLSSIARANQAERDQLAGGADQSTDDAAMTKKAATDGTTKKASSWLGAGVAPPVASGGAEVDDDDLPPLV